MQQNHSIISSVLDASTLHCVLDKPSISEDFYCMGNQKELWKTIPNLGGYYKISTYGNVKAKERSYINTFGTNRTKVIVPARMLKLSLDNGYKRVELTIQSPQKTMRASVHRLVAQAFIHNPENKPHVNHIDGNRSNNHVSNLEWCTPLENVHHAMKFLGHRPGVANIGKVSNQRRKVKQIDPVSGEVIKIWDCILHIRLAKAGGSSIFGCLQGARKISNGYKWRYE